MKDSLEKGITDRRITFRMYKEIFVVKDKKDIDTLPVAFLRKIKFVTLEELKEKERMKMLKIAKERERKWGTFFPKVTLYHNLFDVFIIEKLDISKIVRYKVKWTNGIP